MFFFSPAAYKGQRITRFDCKKDFANSVLSDKTLEYLWGSKILTIFLFLNAFRTPFKIEIISVGW